MAHSTSLRVGRTNDTAATDAPLLRVLLHVFCIRRAVPGAASALRTSPLPCLTHDVIVQAILGRLVQVRYPYIKLPAVAVTQPWETALSIYTAAGIYLAFAAVCLGIMLRASRSIRRYDAVDVAFSPLSLHDS